VKSGFLKDYLQEPQDDQTLVVAGADEGHEVPFMVKLTKSLEGFQEEDASLPVKEVRRRGDGSRGT